MLKYRLIIGILLIVGLLALLLVDGWLNEAYGVGWAPVFFGVLGLVATASVYEMARLFRRRGWRIYEMPTLAAVLASLSLAAVSQASDVRLRFDAGPLAIGPAALILTLLLMGLLAVEVARNWRSDGIDLAVQSIGGSLIIALYVGLLLLFVVAVRFLPDGLDALLVFLGVAKGSDIGAYAVGRLLGRHKLIPRLSPGKTVEGCIGGLALGVAVGLALGTRLLDLAAWQCALFGVVVSLVAMLGDLAESLFKRASQAKDSSEILPGFGGVLDIMDSILLAAPAAYGLLAAFAA